MRKRIVGFAVLVACAGVGLVLWRSATPVQKADSTVGRGEVTPAAASALPNLASPIGARLGAPPRGMFTFYGVVVDEKGEAVPGAKVSYSIHSSHDPAEPNPRGETESDAKGEFTIRGQGVGIYLEVSKIDYHRVKPTDGALGSSRNFSNGGPLSTVHFPMPTAAERAKFVLRKAGVIAPLIHFNRVSLRALKDGTPVEVDLKSGQAVAVGRGSLRIEMLTLNDGLNPNLRQPYDWECRLTIPGGGLIERTDERLEEAPEFGYTPVFQIGQKKTANDWKSRVQKEFFIKTPDKCYARVAIEIVTGGDHFFVFDSWLNPRPGERNLASIE